MAAMTIAFVCYERSVTPESLNIDCQRSSWLTNQGSYYGCERHGLVRHKYTTHTFFFIRAP